MKIAIVNQSTLVSPDAAAAMVAAWNIFMAQVAAVWERTPATVCLATADAIPADANAVGVLLDNADQANALGYHEETNDVVDFKIFAQPVLDNGGVPLYDSTNPQNVSIASVGAHEIVETWMDFYANQWADGPAIAEGGEYAYETADPVEADSYTVDIGTPDAPQLVSVTNFVTPKWFDPEATAADGYDYLNNLTAPFSKKPDGYMIVRDNQGNAQQVHGEQRPEWRKAMQASSPLSRSVRRTSVN